MSLGVNQEAITALHNMKARIEELQQDLKRGADSLSITFDENRAGLGAHTQSIQKLLDDLNASSGNAGKPVKKLARRLNRSAAIRQGAINDNSYSSRSR